MPPENGPPGNRPPDDELLDNELPLDGVRVLDLSGEMGSYGTMLLASAGADVVKVEPAGGDRQRRRPPFAGGVPDIETSLVFAYYNAGKRGVELDLADRAAERALRRLAAGADVVVIAPSRRTPVPGWDPAARRLAWADPASIICCLTSFGTGGPDDDLRATHLTSFAASGQMWAAGPEGEPPRAIPGMPLYPELSAHAATAILAALRERRAVGPQVIELSLHDMLAYRDSVAFAVYGTTGSVLSTRAAAAGGVPPIGSWDASDGRVEFLVYNPPHWDGFVELLGRPADLTDPALRDRATRAERAAQLTPVVASLLRELTVEDIVTRAQRLRVPCAPQYLPADLVTDPQLASRGFWAEQRHERIGSFRAPGLPFMSKPALLRRSGRPAPLLGEHNNQLLNGASELMAPTTAASQPDGPRLAGLRVVSFGTAIAGNVSATTLAEMGADVIKIESPNRPDPLRTGPIGRGLPRVFEPSGVETNLMFASYSRSCRSVALDMKDPAAQEVFTRLIAGADVLIDNFASGVMAGWGLTHEKLAQDNPRLVMITVSGYGRTGPRSHYMAYGSNINSFMGLTRAWAPHGTQFDYTAVAHVLFAVFAALTRRDRTGEGAIVDIAQVEAGAAMLAPIYLGALNSGDTAVPEPNAVPGSAFAAVLRAAGDDQWVAVELEDEADVTTAAELVGHRDLAPAGDPAPGSGDAGPGRLEPLRSALADWAAARTPEQAALLLQAAGLAAAAVRGTPEEFHDAQLWARGGVTEVDHPDLGLMLCPSPFQRLSAAPLRIRRPSARLGQHTEEVLAQWLKPRALRAAASR